VTGAPALRSGAPRARAAPRGLHLLRARARGGMCGGTRAGGAAARGAAVRGALHRARGGAAAEAAERL